MNYSNQMHAGPEMITFVEPYVYQTLQTLIGKFAVIQTVRDSLRGKVMDVKPDHIVVQVGDSTFFVRCQQIVSVMPD
ncbi:YuzF family protein [Metabacillus litoralis]|uniref:YuzF family protein n=1 Tax=Metabacillus litoralis TaxID=152268 RepID=UPI001CFD8145|nr:YuzF family protein [Metabacillus litoralis]